jgi:hypothetical protein
MVILVSSSAEKTPTFWHGKKRRKKLKGVSSIFCLNVCDTTLKGLFLFSF